MSWQIDASHSNIHFTVRHMMISKVRGQFEKFDGTINFDPDQPENSTFDISIDVNTINTRDETRDNHLRSPDFFDAAEFPVMTFKSTKVEQIDEDSGKLYGELTIRDKTQPVILAVEYAGLAKSPWGTTSAGFSASATVYRKDWDLNWNQALETGGFLVGDKIKIDIDLELIKQEEAVPA